MILHFDIFVNSLDKSEAFYVKYFNFEVIERIHVKADYISKLYKKGYNSYSLSILKDCYFGAKLELMEIDGSEKIVSTNTTITLYVNSIDEKYTELKEIGLYPVTDKIRIKGRYSDSNIIFYKDPNGIYIELLEKGDK